MLIHILKSAETTTAKEKEQLAKLDKYQKKYLSGLCCGACDHPLDRVGCGTVYNDNACDEQTRIARREKALLKYKPRLNRRKKK
jgi:hypothetical protein